MIYFNVHGINLNVISDDDNISRFIKDSLGYFLLNKEISSCNYEIEVKIFVNKSVQIEEQIRGFNKIGNLAYIKEDVYVCIIDKYLLKIKKKENKLQVNVFMVDKKTIYLKLRASLKKLIKGSDYFNLLRQVIIFPLFWALARFSGIYAMHSGSVNLLGNGVAFVGLAGVGKSTNSLALTLKHNGLLVGDNYTLYDKNKLYQFPEWIRISSETRNILGDSLNELGEKHFTRYGRGYHLLNDKYISLPVSPAIMFVQMLGQENKINKISTNVALDRILLSNAHVKEFHEHSLIGLIDFMYQFDISLYESMVGDLRHLITDIPVYEMVIKKYGDISDVYNNIKYYTKRVGGI
jgi:hypothetical protein